MNMLKTFVKTEIHVHVFSPTFSASFALYNTLLSVIVHHGKIQHVFYHFSLTMYSHIVPKGYECVR